MDSLGNTEASKPATYVIDRTAPDFSVTGIPATPTSQTVTPVLVTSEPTYTVVATMDGAPFTFGSSESGEGTHTLEVTLTDAFGNSATKSYTFVIDKTGPDITVAPPSGSFAATVSVSVLTSDSGSGIAENLYRIDGGAWTAYTGAFDVAGEGTHTVQAMAVDGAGNVTITVNRTYVIDTTAPVTTATGVSSAPTSATVNVTLSADDGTGTGVAATYYILDGGAQTPYAGAISVDTTPRVSRSPGRPARPAEFRRRRRRRPRRASAAAR